MPAESLIDRIDQCLPQTQCTLCTYPRCKEYARAIAAGEAEINQCPPGGEATINALAGLLDRSPLPLNPENGVTEHKTVAFIEEKNCIGCRLCIKACPVECIIGGPKLLHTVITAQCTGCKLCLPVCPTDCITMHPVPEPECGDASSWPGFTWREIQQARINTERKLSRMQRRERKRQLQKRKASRGQMQQEILDAVRRKSTRTDQTL